MCAMCVCMSMSMCVCVTECRLNMTTGVYERRLSDVAGPEPGRAMGRATSASATNMVQQTAGIVNNIMFI